MKSSEVTTEQTAEQQDYSPGDTAGGQQPSVAPATLEGLVTPDSPEVATLPDSPEVATLPDSPEVATLPDSPGSVTGWLERARRRHEPWIVRWYLRLRIALPFFSLATGIISLILFRRGFGYIRFVIAYLAILWLLPIVLAALTRGEADGPRAQVARKASEFLAQALYQESYFFLLPFYVASSVPWSGQGIFLALLVSGLLISTFDPLYLRWVVGKRWFAHLFYGFSFFACLNFILPVVMGMRNHTTLYVSGITAVLLTLPMLTPWRRLLSPAGLGRALVGIALVLAVLRLALPIVPPAPLKVVKGVFATALDPRTRRPVKEITTLRVADLTRLYAYTPIFAPLGIKETIVHEWRHEEGFERDRIVLHEIAGGREQGYRTWSAKSNFGDRPAGHWTVDVRTSSGQLMGRMRLEVTP